MKNIQIFAIILMLFLIPLVPALPTQTNVNNIISLQVEFPIIEAIKINTDHELSFRVFNISNGLRLDNESVVCTFNLNDKNGRGIINESFLEFNTINNDWEIIILGANFSEIGGYNALVDCNDGGFGGFAEFDIIVTKTGFILDISEALIYFILALGVFFLFILAFYFMLATPYSNKIDEKTGAVIQLTKLKYVKLGFIMLTWVLLTWFLNILVALSGNLVTLSLYSGFFGFMFDLMNRLALPFGIIIIVIGLFEIIRDANLYENLKKLGETMR